MNRTYFVAATLVFSAFLTWSTAMAKIEHFKDDTGTLHITNSPEDQAKPKAGAPPAMTPTPPAFPEPPPGEMPQGEVVEEPVPEPEPPPEVEGQVEAPPIEEEVPPSE
jgi:hypothetical protein